MFIAIDGNEANAPQRVGSNVYAHRLLQGINHFDPHTHYQIYLKSKPASDMPPASPHWRYRIFGPRPAWTRWRLPLDLYLTHPRPHLFFTPGHYAPAFSPVPTVISIMDLAFLYFPETFTPRALAQLKSWTKSSALSATHIFTISHHSKGDIIKHYGIDPAKITVTYPGSGLEDSPRPSEDTIHNVLAAHSLPEKYFLFIGTNQPRKNLPRLLDAYSVFSKKHPDIKLVLVGKTWHQFSRTNLTLLPGVTQLDYLDQPELLAVLSGAQALIFPSLYEGFGLPVLEAMQLGVPVAAALTSSIPEITADSPLLFDPTSAQAMVSALAKAASLTGEAKQKLIKQGKIKAKAFTWEKCTKQTLEVLHELTL